MQNPVSIGRLAALTIAFTGAVLTSPALAVDPAVTPTAVVLEGDTVLGVGLVTGVYNLSINDAGNSYVEVDTDNTNTVVDYAIVFNGPNLFWQEGQPLTNPVGADIDSFDAMSLANTGNSAYVWDLGNTAGGSADDYAVYYFNGATDSLLMQEGDTVGFSGVTAGTPWTYFAECKINDADEMVVIGYCDDPAISGTSDFAVVKYDVGTGTQTLLALETQTAPGTSETFFSFSSDPASNDINDLGDIIYQGNLTGDSAKDRALYINNTLLLREGDDSPVAGRKWSNLSGANVGLSDDGDWACLGHIDGDSATKRLLVVNGDKVAQEGDTHPDFAPAVINFMASPVEISDDGDVLYTADWNLSQDSGLFINNKLLIQSGVTQVNGQTVERVYGSTDTLAMSDDGRYIIAEVLLPGSTDAAVVIDRGPWEILGGELAGANGEPRLRGWGSLTGGSSVTVDLDRAVPNGTANLIIGINNVSLPFMCTTLIPNPDIILFGLPTDADGRLSFTSTLPAVVPSGVNFHMQYFVDDTSACMNYSASNAVRGQMQ